MRQINYLVVHCTATPPTATVEAIKKYWKEVKGWGDTPGYHYLIHRDGEIEELLDESKISYGAYGHNPECVHISYIGGIDENGKPLDNRTSAQKQYGKVNGWQTEYYENGKLKKETKYKDGIIELVKDYDENGNLIK